MSVEGGRELWEYCPGGSCLRNFLGLALLVACAPVPPVFGQASRSIAPETVVVASGKLRLQAFLWRPAGSAPFPAVLFAHGSGSTVSSTGGFVMTDAAKILGPVFQKHGYAFLYLFRRGQGLSAGQGPFMQDILRHEKTARGEESQKHLQFVLLTTDHLDDVTAGVAFLKRLPEVDARRIAIMGHSFGGQLSLLAAERDSTIRAAVTFGAAAGSWEGSSELRERLLAAVRKTTVPVMLLHAENDYSVAPGKALAAELESLGKPHVLKIYGPIGQTPDAGHNFVYTAVSQWEDDVFKFLNEYVAR
jgi:dienelactone hydrolase